MSDSISGVDLGTVGTILMAVGAVGLVITLVLSPTRRRTDVIHQPAVGHPAAPGRTTYVEPDDPCI